MDLFPDTSQTQMKEILVDYVNKCAKACSMVYYVFPSFWVDDYIRGVFISCFVSEQTQSTPNLFNICKIHLKMMKKMSVTYVQIHNP